MVRWKARPAGPRRPPLDSARRQRPKSAAAASWVDLIEPQSQIGCKRNFWAVSHGYACSGDFQNQELILASQGGSLGRGEGRLKYHLGGFSRPY